MNKVIEKVLGYCYEFITDTYILLSNFVRILFIGGLPFISVMIFLLYLFVVDNTTYTPFKFTVGIVGLILSVSGFLGIKRFRDRSGIMCGLFYGVFGFLLYLYGLGYLFN